jgi:hypothetical protein
MNRGAACASISRTALVVLTFAAPTLAACSKSSASDTGTSGQGSGSSSGGDASSEAGSIAKSELTGCVDTDLTDSSFAGPGWDSTTNAPSGTPQASYLAATTMGLVSDAAMQTALNQLGPPVFNELATQPGLIGYMSANSQKCQYIRTFTVWKDRTSMEAFVMSTPHATAMSQVRTVARAAAFVTWTIDASALPPTWAMARQQIATNPNTLFEAY